MATLRLPADANRERSGAKAAQIALTINHAVKSSGRKWASPVFAEEVDGEAAAWLKGVEVEITGYSR